MRLPGLSLRLRIGLAIFLVASAALVLMSLAIYEAFGRSLRESFTDTVAARVASDLALVNTGELEDVEAAALGPEDRIFRVYSASGALLADQTPWFPAIEAERALAARPGGGKRDLSYGEEDFRVVVTPIEGGSGGMLVSGISRDPVDEPLGILRSTMLIAVPLTSLALAAGGYLIAHAGLRPVRGMSATAKRITAGRLGERIPGTGQRDELGELRTSFNTMLDRLEETIERERRFTADASHELRTPLAAIEANIGVTLSRERSPEDYRESLETVLQQAGRLRGIASRLLFLARLDVTQAEKELTQIDLGDLVQVSAGAFMEENGGPRIEVRAAPGVVIDGDLELLSIALTNVFENTRVHAGPEAELAVTVSATDGWAVVRAHDNGPGIPPGLAAFERFRRGEDRRRAGAGLGLAIVKAVARYHGGEARVLPSAEGALLELTLSLAPRRV